MGMTWTDSPLIKKIKLPSGNEYYIADREARANIDTLSEAIAGGVSFIIAWDGESIPVIANIPEGITVVYNNVDYTGTLSAGSATPGAFYLIKSATQTSSGSKDVYDEYVPVGETGSKTWEKIGDTQLDLTDVVTGVTLSKSTDVVLGEGTTFTMPQTNVSFTGETTDVVLGESTTFEVTSGNVTFGTPSTDSVVGADSTYSVTDPTITVTPSTTYLGAVANGSTNAITSITPSEDTFIKSVDVEQGSKMVTDTIVGTNGTDTATLVSDKVDESLVTTTVTGVSGSTSASKATAATSQTTADGTTTSSSTNTDILKGASVSNEILTLGACTLDTQTTTQFTFSDVTVPKAATSATTVATGALSSTGSGATLVKSFSTSTKTLAKVAASAKTFATGSLSSTGSGASVVTGVSITASASAITSLGTPSSTAFLTGVKLSSYTASGTNRFQVATGISSAFASGTSVTHNTDDLVSAITSMPTASFSTAITVGTNDKVTAITSIGSGKISSTSITVGTNDKVTVLTDSTTLSVTKGNS